MAQSLETQESEAGLAEHLLTTKITNDAEHKNLKDAILVVYGQGKEKDDVIEGKIKKVKKVQDNQTENLAELQKQYEAAAVGLEEQQDVLENMKRNYDMLKYQIEQMENTPAPNISTSSASSNVTEPSSSRDVTRNGFMKRLSEGDGETVILFVTAFVIIAGIIGYVVKGKRM